MTETPHEPRPDDPAAPAPVEQPNEGDDKGSDDDDASKQTEAED